MASLVIVESPTKARTIRDFLPKGYCRRLHGAHPRSGQWAADIPAKLKGEEGSAGVNVDNDFEPLYVVPADKKKVVKELKDLLKDADELILATDEDREGESISWHLTQVLMPKVKVRRMVFHEITREAIREALDTTRDVDDKLVRPGNPPDPRPAVRIHALAAALEKDRLRPGRRGEPAAAAAVLRERERRAFRRRSTGISRRLAHQRQEFDAELVSVKGVRVASGKDFDEDRKARGRQEVVLLDEPWPQNFAIACRKCPWRVAANEEKPGIRRPAAPFTTSTLQQEANRKLRLSARGPSTRAHETDSSPTCAPIRCICPGRP